MNARTVIAELVGNLEEGVCVVVFQGHAVDYTVSKYVTRFAGCCLPIVVVEAR